MKVRRFYFRAAALLLAAIVPLVVLGVVPTPVVSTPQAAAASVVQITNFGSNPGDSNMYIYVPDNVQPNAALVVMPNPATFAHTAYDHEFGWTDLADRWKNLIVVFDEHPNDNYTCDMDHDAANGRGGTEATSTKQMVDYAKANYSIDPSKVFITGLSCGGIWSAYMAVDYPDVFAGAGIVAGYPFRCPNGQRNSCIGSVTNKTPQQWGDLARTQNPSWNGPWPKISSWQATNDFLMPSGYQQELVDQWTNLHGTDLTADATETISGFTHKTYNASGGPVIETWTHSQMGHKYPVSPGSGAANCGQSGTLAYSSLCGAYYMAKFWGINPDFGGGGTTTTTAPTTTTTTTPPGGETTVTFGSVDANDGYVRAYDNGTSPEVGTNESTVGLLAGRTTAWPYKHMRTVLSFDTASIPDGATISRAYVTVDWKSQYGNPWSNPSGNTLQLDVKTGCFGAACTTATDDWAAAATANNVATIASFMGGSKQSSDFAAAGRTAINKTGTTQVKMRFSQFQTLTYFIGVQPGAQATLTVVYS